MKKIKLFGLGALFGAIAGLLFAPKSGKELREDIKKLSEEIIAEAEEKLKEVEVLTKEKYTQIITEIIKSHIQAKKIKQEDIPHLIEGLKNHWKEIEKELEEGRAKDKKQAEKK